MDITKVVDKTKISEVQVGAASKAKTQAVKPGAVDVQKALLGAGTEFSGNEKVKWSEDAELATEALHTAKATPDVRASKVAELRAAIKNGTYKVDAHKVAENMIQASLEEDLLSKKD